MTQGQILQTTETPQAARDYALLKALWLRGMEPGADDLEEAWQAARKLFSIAEMATEIIAADYEGTFCGESGGRGLSDETYDYLHGLM